jgi:hypothetical protein
MWISATCWYWFVRVPLKPAASFNMRRYGSQAGIDGEGDFVFAAGHDDSQKAIYGPLRFFDPLSGELKREALTSEDRLLGVSEKCRFAVIERADAVYAVDLHHPEHMLLCPVAGPVQSAAVSDDGRFVAADHRNGPQEHGELDLWDMAENRFLWKRRLDYDDRWFLSDPDPGLKLAGIGASAVRLKVGEENSIVWWDLKTGESRRDLPTSITELAADERVYLDNEMTVRATADSHALWTAPGWFRNKGLHFTGDGMRVACFGERNRPDGGTVVNRVEWDAWDGPPNMRQASEDVLSDEQIQPQMLDALASDDGSAVAIARFAPSWTPPNWVSSALAVIRIPWKMTGHHWIEFRELSGNQILGFVPDGQLSLIPGHQGLAVTDDWGIRTYAFRPSRDWLWLIFWGLTFPLLITIAFRIAIFARMRRRSRQLAASTKPESRVAR